MDRNKVIISYRDGIGTGIFEKFFPLSGPGKETGKVPVSETKVNAG